jgi:hypothetical protein
MEFLLILFAMLSAATGALTGARGQEPRLEQAMQAQATPVAARSPICIVCEATSKVAAEAGILPPVLQSLPHFALSRAVALDGTRLIE